MAEPIVDRGWVALYLSEIRQAPSRESWWDDGVPGIDPQPLAEPDSPVTYGVTMIDTDTWCVIVAPFTEEVATTATLAIPGGVLRASGVARGAASGVASGVEGPLLLPPPHALKRSISAIASITSMASRFRNLIPSKAILTAPNPANDKSNPAAREFVRIVGTNSAAVPAV